MDEDVLDVLVVEDVVVEGVVVLVDVDVDVVGTVVVSFDGGVTVEVVVVVVSGGAVVVLLSGFNVVSGVGVVSFDPAVIGA